MWVGTKKIADKLLSYFLSSHFPLGFFELGVCSFAPFSELVNNKCLIKDLNEEKQDKGDVGGRGTPTASTIATVTW